MIIRMTVHDNDYTDVIESFCRDLKKKLLFYDEEVYSTIKNFINKVWYWDYRRKLVNLLNPNEDRKLNKEEKKFICTEIIHLWEKYVSSTNLIDSIDYLINSFQVTITYRLNDEWKNNEVVYFFFDNDKFITL
jgi:hypothetical protein